MFSLYHYVYAKMRLKAADHDINNLDGDINPLILAQRDMIQHEVEYFKDKTKIMLLAVFIISILGLFVGWCVL